MEPKQQSLCEALDHQISTPSEATVESIRERPKGFAVLGAGGKMGFHLCLMLRKSLKMLGRSDTVYAVSRFSSVRGRQEFDAIGCETIVADLSDPDQVRHVPRVPNVFFMAGVKFGTGNDPDLLQRMNVAMPRLVAEHAREAEIVAFSTGCVYSFVAPESGGSTEADETKPIGQYANSCRGREQAFFHAGREFGTRSALIRLNYSIDCRYGVLVDLAQKVAGGHDVDVTMGYVNVIWQGDALQYIVQSLSHASAPPFVLNVTGSETLSVRELALQLGKRFGKTVNFVGEEASTAWLNNAEKSHAMFGSPPTTIDTMLDRVVDWIQKGGPLMGKPTHFETRDGSY
ncbi:MAG: NAD(P)-dependent oxidoreductase [Planctomycetota bacterium]